MEATNFANRHEQLGVGTHGSTGHHAAQKTDDIYDNTVNPGPTLREEFGTRARDFAQEQDPGNNSSSPIHSSAPQARANTVLATEIGDPDGRIPTAQDTHNQLDAARDGLAAARRNNPAAASSTVTQGVPRTHPGATDTGVPTSQREHRNSNYAPGYEAAADAVKPKSHKAEDHRPSVLAHEPVTPLTEVPPDLDGTTDQTTSSKGPGMIPGPSTGQKVKAPFAKFHGAGEVIRGNLAAAADSFTRDKDKRAEDEDIVRKGQEELTYGKFDKGQKSRVEH